MKTERSTTARLDFAGAGLIAITAAWFLLSSTDKVGGSLPAIAVLTVVAGGFLIARVAAQRFTRSLPAALIVGVASVAMLVSRGPSAPLGYANANGIYFALAAFAALSLWSTARSRVAGICALVVALVFGLITVVTGSFAATALLALAPGVVFAVRFGAGRIAILACAAVFLIAGATTVALGFTYSGRESVASSALTGRRLALWHEAILIVGRYPVTGAGFGRFEELSPTALSDRDARWAHNEFLQVAAETGIPGLVLVASLFLWGFARLGVEPVSAASVLAAAGLAAVGIHASVDYVLHFVAVPLSGAVLVGAALARGEHRGGDPFRYDTHSDFDQRPR